MPLRFVARRFLPHTPAPEAVAGLLSVLVGVSLLAVKFLAYFLTGSEAIFSDAMESIVNVLAAAFALYALFYAHRPADREHPYGHGKIEFLSAGFEGGMIFLAALVIAFQSIDAMIHRPPLNRVPLGLALMGAAMVVNGALGLYLIRAGRKHKSLALEADGKHLFADAVTSGAAVVGLAIVMLKPTWTLADPITALLIAVYITYTAVGLMRTSAAGLMDQQDLADEAMLVRILDSHLAPDGKPPQICSYHKLRHRHSGRYHWVDFHLMAPPSLTIDQGHAIASAIEYEIEQALGEGNATAHVEPCVEVGCARCGGGAKAARDPSG